MAPKGNPPGPGGSGAAAPARAQAPQAPRQQHPPAKPAPLPKRVEEDAGSDEDDNAPLPLVDQKYLSDKKFAEFNIHPNSKR